MDIDLDLLVDKKVRTHWEIMDIDLDLVGRTLDAIIANPKNWDQDSFCGTTYCYAGYALLVQGYPVNRYGDFIDLDGRTIHGVSDAARTELGLSYAQADDLFYYFPRDVLDDRGEEWSVGAGLRLMIERVAEVTGIDPAPYLAKVADLP